MKGNIQRLISFLLTVILLISNCLHTFCAEELDNNNTTKEALEEYLNDHSFTGLSDPKLLQYTEDVVYAELAESLSNEDYIIENVSTVYISKEYLEELEFNSKANIFFGYTLAELEEQFQGTKYIFTLDDNNETTVRTFEEYDDSFQTVLKNIAIGSGVILICVTVSVVTNITGLTTISTVFASSAKEAVKYALIASAQGSASAGFIDGVLTQDMDKALKALEFGGSEGFKWGAIVGAISGGAKELRAIYKIPLNPIDIPDIPIPLKDNQVSIIPKIPKDGNVTPVHKIEILGEYINKGTVEIAENLEEWQKAELRALNDFGGYSQITYLNKKQVPFATAGATRPDIVNIIGDHIEAVEVKYYDLENKACLNSLSSVLKQEVSDRILNLPEGSTQRIILDVTNRNFSEATCNAAKDLIWTALKDIYPNIPIDIVGLI